MILIRFCVHQLEFCEARSCRPLQTPGFTFTSDPSTISNQALVPTPDSQSSSNTGSHVLPLAIGLPWWQLAPSHSPSGIDVKYGVGCLGISPRIQPNGGGALPFIVPHSLTVDRKQARRAVFPPPPESTAPPPYTKPSQAGSLFSPEMSSTSISLTGTSSG